MTAKSNKTMRDLVDCLTEIKQILADMQGLKTQPIVVVLTDNQIQQLVNSSANSIQARQG